MLIPLITTLALAKDLPGEELFVNERKFEISQSHHTQTESISPNQLAKRSLRPVPALRASTSVLPVEYLRPLTRQSTESQLVEPPKGSVEIFRQVKVGETLNLTVKHSVIAFPDEKSPVIAISSQPKYRGLKFIGESVLEPNSQRIFIHFTRIAVGDKIYHLKASGLSDNGQPGLVGEYHSREAEYFTGTFISSFAAGYFDSLVPRQTNVFGQVQTDTSVDSAIKKGLASGALSSADRFKEKLKKVPEFSELKGPIELSALILEQPISKE